MLVDHLLGTVGQHTRRANVGIATAYWDQFHVLNSLPTNPPASEQPIPLQARSAVTKSL